MDADCEGKLGKDIFPWYSKAGLRPRGRRYWVGRETVLELASAGHVPCLSLPYGIMGSVFPPFTFPFPSFLQHAGERASCRVSHELRSPSQALSGLLSIFSSFVSIEQLVHNPQDVKIRGLGRSHLKITASWARIYDGGEAEGTSGKPHVYLSTRLYSIHISSHHRRTALRIVVRWATAP